MVTASDVDVLLVEDNPADEELTLRSLKAMNLANRVLVARDGADALELLFTTNHRPKVVLLDLKLPKVDGLEVLARIRGDARTRTLPVVVLTSSREGPDIERCYTMGVNSYIVKPVNFDAFVKAVSDVGLYWLLLNEAPQ